MTTHERYQFARLVNMTAFLASPSVVTQAAARKAWRAAREAYGQSEAFRFYVDLTSRICGIHTGFTQATLRCG